MALVVRYQMRFYAYFYLLSPTQPWSGLLGDEVVDDQAPGVAGGPKPERWVVAKGARTLVIVMIVIGAIVGVVVQANTKITIKTSTNGTSTLAPLHTPTVPPVR